ncbi:hypothetical protein [Aquitalea palustris]|uniref:hypothetical protein n=1 Tax=Aquitalea palustris TaxID=2480983 RepID=UPI001CF077DC|nr:hypothetical protein [Aquitalea palustris]
MTRTFSCISEAAQGKTIIDGVITELKESGLPAWCNDYQVARVADWYVCLPIDCGARLGSEIRIVQPRRVRVDGSWFDAPEHQTLVQKIWNKALDISTLGLCPLVLYSGKEGVWKVESH